MQHLASTLIHILRKGLLLVAFVCLLNMVSWFALPNSSATAASSPDEYLQEIKKDQSVKDRQEAYQEATEVTEDPKVGVEKEYEEEVDDYLKEHPDEGGVLQGAKNLVDKVTGK